MPKCVVVDTAFTWGNDRPLHTPWHEPRLLRTARARLHDAAPRRAAGDRGTFAGLSSPRVIEHLVDLGVTTIELLPVHAFVDDRHLVEKRLRNYWGYNPIGFFAPEPRYLSRPITTSSRRW